MGVSGEVTKGCMERIHGAAGLVRVSVLVSGSCFRKSDVMLVADMTKAVTFPKCRYRFVQPMWLNVGQRVERTLIKVRRLCYEEVPRAVKRSNMTWCRVLHGLGCVVE